MAGNLVQAEANRLLDASFGTAAFTAPTTPMKLALTSVISTAASAGTEVTGGSYGRQTIAFTSAASGATANTALISFTNMPAITVVGIDIYDNNGSPRRAWWGPVTPNKAVGAGDTISFAIGAITVALA